VTIGTGLENHNVYAAMCLMREIEDKDAVKFKCQKYKVDLYVCVCGQKIFWTMAHSQNCSIRRNIDLPSEGENWWAD
jgi:hypothetical protein